MDERPTSSEKGPIYLPTYQHVALVLYTGGQSADAWVMMLDEARIKALRMMVEEESFMLAPGLDSTAAHDLIGWLCLNHCWTRLYWWRTDVKSLADDPVMIVCDEGSNSR